MRSKPQSKPKRIRVIPWEKDLWGVSLEYGGYTDSYMVGSEDEAHAEAKRVGAAELVEV